MTRWSRAPLVSWRIQQNERVDEVGATVGELDRDDGRHLPPDVIAHLAAFLHPAAAYSTFAALTVRGRLQSSRTGRAVPDGRAVNDTAAGSAIPLRAACDQSVFEQVHLGIKPSLGLGVGVQGRREMTVEERAQNKRGQPAADGLQGLHVEVRGGANRPQLAEARELGLGEC
jgi:hypothetical protein